MVPEEAHRQLRELAARVEHRTLVMDDWGFGARLACGRGVTALFAGPSGTGKTMAAEVIAAELGLDLFAIDLSAVVSKYIGETEKNLARVFGAAADSDAILLFDEADALFGKRSEVRDAHDRYANIEIAYLLQRMEQYDGIAILATNLRHHIDEAFTRRLDVHRGLPVPGHGGAAADLAVVPSSLAPARRRRGPRRPGPPPAVGRQHPERRAAGARFLAAGDGGPIGMPQFVAATRRELREDGQGRTGTGPTLPQTGESAQQQLIR